MAKSSARKRQRLESGKAKPIVSVLPSPPLEAGDDDASDLIGGLILPEELQITIETLQTLAAHPHVLKSKAFRQLKTAVWDLQTSYANTAGSGNGASLVSKTSLALADGRYTDAMVYLAEMRLRGQRPKLGALQRWVRDCDAASRKDGEVIWEVLEAILRTTEDDVEANKAWAKTKRARGDVVARTDDWVTAPPTGFDLWKELQAGTLIEHRATLTSPFLPLQVTPGHLRRPPNQYPSTVFYSPSNPLALSQNSHDPVIRLDHPSVPGAFMLHNVLSSGEARRMVQAAESVGLEKDQPVAGTAKEQQSILADNLVWLADPDFMSTLYDRVRAHLPQQVDNGALASINARFRIYRYVPGSTYRPHIDGAWPASALGADAQGAPAYVYDSDPELYSRLTFLLYLNDGFPGGQTTFFLPARGGEGQLVAYPVRPVMGSALVFPHGDTRGSLLHEGSAVHSGAKYVIRTEVLYRVGRAGRGGADLDGA